MTNRPPSASRRSVLGLMGAAQVAASGVLATSGTAGFANTDTDTPQPGRSIPKALQPGGEFDRFVAQQAAEDEFSGTVLLAYRGEPVLTVPRHGQQGALDPEPAGHHLQPRLGRQAPHQRARQLITQQGSVAS